MLAVYILSLDDAIEYGNYKDHFQNLFKDNKELTGLHLLLLLMSLPYFVLRERKMPDSLCALNKSHSLGYSTQIIYASLG